MIKCHRIYFAQSRDAWRPALCQSPRQATAPSVESQSCSVPCASAFYFFTGDANDQSCSELAEIESSLYRSIGDRNGAARWQLGNARPLRCGRVRQVVVGAGWSCALPPTPAGDKWQLAAAVTGEECGCYSSQCLCRALSRACSDSRIDVNTH